MSDRTTINIDKESHREAKAKKEELGHSWPEVLQWYAENAGEEDTTVTGDRAELIEDIRDQLERLDDDYERPQTDPVDYAEIESRMERVIERMLR